VQGGMGEIDAAATFTAWRAEVARDDSVVMVIGFCFLVHHERVISSGAARPMGRAAESRDLVVKMYICSRNKTQGPSTACDFRFATNHSSLGMTGLWW
jgi:hypothetical protein